MGWPSVFRPSSFLSSLVGQATMNRRQKILYKRILSVFVPVLILFVLGFFGTNAYFAYQMLHPKRRAVLNTPHGYEQLLQKPIWDNKTWTGGGGTEMTGWLLFQDHPAPFVILSHGYGANREELLGPSYELWDAGYNVIAYDLRGHGESPVAKSTLGPRELEDLKATIQYAKELKSDSGFPLCDGRIGLYGADLGGYVALLAAATDPDVKALVVDTIYPSRMDYVKYQTKRMIGSTTPPDTSFVESAVMQNMISMFMGAMTGGGMPSMDAQEALTQLDGKPVLFIQGKTDPVLYELSERAAALAPRVQQLELAQSRSGTSLFEVEAEEYDQAVVVFFTQAAGFAPPPSARPPTRPTRRRG
jgi:pimeloyl-ACP methyl ester carboxylesterase